MIARALLGTLATNGLNLALSLVTGVLAAHLLLPQGRGELAELLFWSTTFAAFGMLALPTAVARAVAGGHGDARTGASGMLVAVVLSGVICAVFLVSSPWFVKPEILRSATIILCLFVPANLVGLTLLAVDHGNRNFDRYNAFRVLPSLVYLLCMLGLFASGHVSAATLAVASCMGSIAVCAFKLWDSRGALGIAPSLKQASDLVRVGAGIHAGAIASLMLQRLDQLSLIYFFDHGALGLYAVSLTASGIGTGIVSGAIMTVFLPELSRPHDPAARTRYARAALALTTGASAVLAAGLALLAPVLVPLVFGKDFASAVVVTQALCLAQVPYAYVSMALVVLQMMGDWRSGVIVPVIGMVTFLAVQSLVGTSLGPAGVAISYAAAWTGALCLVVGVLRMRLGLSTLACFVPSAADLENWMGRLGLRRA